MEPGGILTLARARLRPLPDPRLHLLFTLPNQRLLPPALMELTDLTPASAYRYLQLPTDPLLLRVLFTSPRNLKWSSWCTRPTSLSIWPIIPNYSASITSTLTTNTTPHSPSRESTPNQYDL